MRIFATFLLLLTVTLCNAADCDLRRPISATQPAWIIHIDVWNYADPQKIIDMVPEDVRPFVIFNIATSSSDDKSADGPAIYDSWMKVCAQNRVWTMIQCASGATNRMPDDGTTTAYEQYFKDYPNFLGFNFAEQFWGFGEAGQVDFPTRLQLFADLMSVCHQYGGYLAVSFTDSYYSSSKMPMAYMKRNEQLRNFLQNDPEHFLCFEKYTLKKNFLDIESNCLGQWLAGYAGQYGIRFDSSGWLTAADETDQTRGASSFVRAAGAIPIVEHAMLTGQTMMDGPELTWTECSQEVSATTTSDGYKQRQWEWFPQFQDISLDIFRKILDGTIRIPTRDEVRDRTKVCLVNDISKNLDSEGEHDSYITPERLFDGLYRSDSDQGGTSNHWIANRWWTKTTGRYPTIPLVYSDVDGMTCFKKSQYDKTTFDAWMQQHFDSEYSGDIFAGRHDNGWVTYNPYQYDETTASDGYRVCSAATSRATGDIPLQYNTCSRVQLDYAPYSLGVMKEYADHLTFYLTNYEGATDIITIQGAAAKPSFTKNHRGSGQSTVTESWENGVYTLTVTHQGGAVDLTVNCAGNETGRKSVPAAATITTPELPAVYTGPLQYEAELADYRDVTIYKTGYNKGHDGYLGQGFVMMNSTTSALRFHTSVAVGGYYLLTVRCQAPSTGILSVTTAAGTSFSAVSSTSSWTTLQMSVVLSEGQQTIVVDNADGATVYVDAIQLEKLAMGDADGVINEDDGIPAVVPSVVVTTDVTYLRNLSAPSAGLGDVTIDGSEAKLYTVCLPYKPTTGNGLRYYTLSAVNDATLVFTEVTAVCANTPYLVAATAGSTNVANGVSTAVNFNSIVNQATVDGYSLRGTLRGLSNEDAAGYYVLQPGNVWGKVPESNPDVYIPPFRAYIVPTTTNSAPLLSAITATTDIRQIRLQHADGSASWYDINGHRIARPTHKGIYINSGKKTVINKN